MGHTTGIVLIILGAILLYSILSKSTKTKGGKNGLILAAIMIIIGGWSIYDENQKKEKPNLNRKELKTCTKKQNAEYATELDANGVITLDT